MTPLQHSPWLHRFAVLTAAATFVLLGAGGLVTSHGVGLAVPNWPNSYDYNMFAFPVSEWIGGIFYEHTHRLIATLVGLLTAILAGWLWVRETHGRSRRIGVVAIVLVLGLMGARNMPVYLTLAGLAPVVMVAGLVLQRRNPGTLRWLGMTALAAVILQGVLGGLRVVWLKDEIGIFHGALAQLFFVLMCAIALFTSRWWRSLPAWTGASGASAPGRPGMRGLLIGTTALIFVQLIMGATMRHEHAGLAIPDFPLAYGKLWPAMDAESVAGYNQRRIEVTEANPITGFQIGLQMAHRITAVLILGAVIACTRRAWRGWARIPLGRLSMVWLGLILIQVVLGAATIWTNKAADIATAHVLVGALSLATGGMLCIVSARNPEPARSRSALSAKPSAGESLSARPAATQ